MKRLNLIKKTPVANTHKPASSSKDNHEYHIETLFKDSVDAIKEDWSDLKKSAFVKNTKKSIEKNNPFKEKH